MKSFFISLFAACLLITLSTLLFVHLRVLAAMPSYFWQTIGFLAFSTGVLFMYVYRATTDSLIQIYLVTLIIKLLAGCGFVMLITIKDKNHALSNVVVFLVAYIIFTGLEITFLYRKINR